MKKFLKNSINIILIFIVCIIVMFCIPIKTHATEGDSWLGNITNGVNSWGEMANNSGISIGITSINPIVAISQVAWWIGFIFCICGTIILAFQQGTGSVEQKAKVKEKWPRWIIICVIIICATSIWNFVISIIY